MIRLHALTQWTGTGTRAVPYHPLLADLYAVAWSDVTGQANVPPAVNAVVIEVLTDTATANAIEADTRFVVLFSEVVNEG